MQAAVFEGPGRLVVREVPAPCCPSGGALLAVHACAVCGSDVRISRHGHAHVRPPQILGHEVVGTIVESDTAEVTVGTRAMVAPAIGCGACRWCRDGRPNRCPELRTIGYEYPGAFAPLLAVPPEAVRQGSVIPVPAGLPDTVACLTEPLACCLNGQELIDIAAGDRVVVVGAGPIGCLHARLATARGAALVILVEQRPERCRQARDMGLGDVLCAGDDTADRIRDLTAGGADAVIVAAPSSEAQQACLAWLAKGGRASYFGGLPPGAGGVLVDTNAIHYRELQVAGAHASSPRQNRLSMELLADGTVRVDDLVTGTFELPETPAAIDIMARGAGLKSVVLPRWEPDRIGT